MNALAQTRSQMPSTGYSHTSLTVELAKMLALVAPITMTTEQQELWLRAAVDSLQDIRGDELGMVSVEVRRSVTRPSQIVPEISRLVAERRSRKSRYSELPSPVAEKAPRPPAPPLTRAELDAMRPNMRSLGLKYGHLTYRDGRLVEA